MAMRLEKKDKKIQESSPDGVLMKFRYPLQNPAR